VSAGYHVSAVLFLHMELEPLWNEVLENFATEVTYSFFAFFLQPLLMPWTLFPTFTGPFVEEQLLLVKEPRFVRTEPALVLNFSVVPLPEMLFILGPSLGLEIWANTTLSIMQRALPFQVIF